MTLTELRATLAALGVRPSRRLGQNFLHDQNLARRIVDLGEIAEGDPVIEIGPGLGALTEDLTARRPGRLFLIERDLRFAAFLRARFPGAQLIEGDALEALAPHESARPDSDAPRFAENRLPQAVDRFTVLGNLPYSVASPLMVRLAEADLRPRRMVFTVQLEVAQRLAAQPGAKDYGLLTLLLQPFYEISIARKLPPSVFWPPPEVASATVLFVRRAGFPFPSLAEERSYRRIVRRAFQQRRKTLGAVFGDELSDPVLRKRRPAEIGVEEWARAAAIAFAGPQSAETDSAEELFDIVDDQDRVVGRAPRRRVHAEQLRHRAIHLFVWNARGQILLQRRSPLKDLAPNAWDSSAAGHLASGEGYEACARREVLEELGARLSLSPLRKFAPVEALGWEHVQLYEARAEGPFRFSAAEISELRWWNPTEVDAAIARHPDDFAPSFRHLWPHRS
ncbi:MAG: ribosomal RNA small subunit methyltransferase A [Verrucomicrobiae bacterium]|nr:ribosomal RNA small subunit methyltransferase A [Verrucomicrobiae bacterium]